MVDLLRAELAPLETWGQFAVEYHRQRKEEHFRTILLSVVDAFDVYEMQEFYKKDPGAFKKGRLRILNLLAADRINALTLAPSEEHATLQAQVRRARARRSRFRAPRAGGGGGARARARS